MKSASLLVTVPDEIYENIIEPKKREKAFASFVNTLLQAYYESPAIQSYVEGYSDNVSQQSMNSLNEAIAKAHSSLARFGLYTEELENTTAMGMEAVKTHSGEGGFKAPSVDSTPLLEQVDSIRSELDAFKKDNKEIQNQNARLLEQNEQLINILGKISSGSLSIVSKAGKPPVRSEGTKEKSEAERVEKAEKVIKKPVQEPKDVIIMDDMVIEEPVVSGESQKGYSTEQALQPPKETVKEPAKEPKPIKDSDLLGGEELLDFGVDFDEEDDGIEDFDEPDTNDDDIFSSFMENNAFTF